MSTSAAESSSNAIYDGLSSSYGYAVDDTLGAQLKYRLVLRHTDARARVIDVGCANGLHLRSVAPHCREIVGIDINQRMLELSRAIIAAENIGNARVVAMSATELAFESASFDVAYSFSTLLLVPDVQRAVAEMARVVRPGGIVVLDITGRRNLAQRHWGSWYRSQGHPGLSVFTWRGACVLLDSVGLDLIDASALGFLDQWRYVPVLRRATFLDGVLHRAPDRDLDFAISNMRVLRPFANRWYVVCRKRG